MQYFPIILVFFIILVLFLLPVVVLLHELGHAVPAILLTKKKVTIYIGSYGDPSKSLHFQIGLLEIWFRYNPFAWRLGLCVPSAKDIPYYKQIVYILTGPITSSVTASIACYIAFSYDLHGFVKLIFVVFFSLSVFDLFVNLIPISKPIKLYDGTITYNDGFLLKRIFFYKKFPQKYSKATELYNQQKFSESAIAFKNMLDKGIGNQEVFQMAIYSFILAKEFIAAKEIIDEFMLQGTMTSDDYSNAGYIYSQLGLHEEALGFYDQSLLLNAHNKNTLNNKGYTFLALQSYEQAISLFDDCITLDPDYAYPYNNRGLCKIKLGNIEEGLADINHSLKLDQNNSYAYLHLGIYHFDKGENKEALAFFKKAKELDNATYMIDDFISKATMLNG